jgi:hypothetical protein
VLPGTAVPARLHVQFGISATCCTQGYLSCLDRVPVPSPHPGWWIKSLKPILPKVPFMPFTLLLTLVCPQVPGVPIMYIQSHRYNIERLPEATVGGAPRQ